jgi:hypothetical protein
LTKEFDRLQETKETETSDKQDWYKDNQLSEDDFKKMIDEKVNRVMKYKLVYPVRNK